MRAVLDTCILVDFLQGIDAAGDEIARYPRPSISVITWMEVLVGARTSPESRRVVSFLDTFQVLDLTRDSAQEAVLLRQRYRMPLPDAVIWATARCHEALLVTRDARDYQRDDPGVRFPYSL